MDIMNIGQDLLLQGLVEKEIECFEGQKAWNEHMESLVAHTDLKKFFLPETEEEYLIKMEVAHKHYSKAAKEIPPGGTLALSVKQPWASAIGAGEQIYEFRDWEPEFLGTIVICSTQTPSKDIYAPEYKDIEGTEKNGCTICLVDVVGVTPWDEVEGTEEEWDNGYFFRWHLENPRLLANTPIKGRLKLYPIGAEDICWPEDNQWEDESDEC